MSYILDALRRADAERERGHVPGIHAQPAWTAPTATGPIGGPVSAGGRRAAVVVGTALLLVLLAGLSWRAFGPATGEGGLSDGGHGLQAPVAGPSTSVSTAPAGLSATSASPGPSGSLATPAAPAPTGLPATGPAPAPAPVRSAGNDAPVDVAGSAAPERPPAIASIEKLLTRPVRKPAPGVATAASANARGAAAGTANTAAATTATPTSSRTSPPPAGPASAAVRIYAVEELPEDVRRELPRLAIGGSIYSESPASRFVIVNGQLFHEGDTLAPGLVLQQIRLKSAVLAFRGYRYGISY